MDLWGIYDGAMMAPVVDWLIAAMGSSLMQHVVSSFIHSVTGKGVIRTGKQQEAGYLLLLPFPLMMKILGKRVTRTGKGCTNMDHMGRKF